MSHPRPLGRPILILALLLAALAATSVRAQQPEYYWLQDGNDTAADGTMRPLGDRTPVIFVHGFVAEDLKIERKVHISFSILTTKLRVMVEKGWEPFQHVAPWHYVYRPSKPYPQLGADFARRVRERFGERMVILVVHSAGALIARTAGPDLDIAAVVGIAPAWGGSPGATLMWGNQKVVEDGKVDAVVHSTLVETREGLKEVPEEVLHSIAWDNSDGVLSPEEIERYGLVVQPKLPDFSFPRLDHYGLLKHFVPAFGAFSFVQQKNEAGKDAREAEWEAIRSWSDKWKVNDGVIVPYPETEADGEYPKLRKDWKGIGHRELFFDKDVILMVWEQVMDLGAQVAQMMEEG